MNSFVVVLVEPEHPHNVGFVARAMRSNGLKNLKIVYSKRSSVISDSYHTAHNSGEVLDSAQIVGSLSEAISDCHFSVAFSRRVFNSVLPHIMLPDLPSSFPSFGNDFKTALVFGRESKGLFVEEVNLCGLVCEIPVAGLMSLNLAQAVSVVAYELCRSGLLSSNGRAHRPLPTAGDSLAEIDQIEKFKAFLMEHLGGRYRDQTWMESFVHQFLQRVQPTRNEMGALFGVARSLSGLSARQEKTNKEK